MDIFLNVWEGGVFLGGGAYLVTVVAGGGVGGGGGRGTDLFPGSSSLSPSFTLSISSLTLGRNALKIGPKAFKTRDLPFPERVVRVVFAIFWAFCTESKEQIQSGQITTNEKPFFSVYIHVTPLHYSVWVCSILVSFLNYCYVVNFIISIFLRMLKECVGLLLCMLTKSELPSPWSCVTAMLAWANCLSKSFLCSSHVSSWSFRLCTSDTPFSSRPHRDGVPF